MATNQQLQLEKQNLEYSRFVKDQVLTEVQLNEIIDFFEDQHRVTRTCLIGTGIVCGLHVRRTATQVTLSEGAAVTTDGDLLKMEFTRYRHFAEYTMPEGGRYEPFIYKEGSQEKTVKLFQLLTNEEKDKITSAQVHSINNLDSFITDWVAILYLEYYLKEPEKCTPTNCDNMGQRQVARPRLLLISKSDLDKVIHRDGDENNSDDLYLKYHEAYESYFTFPVLRPKRVILNQTNTQNSTTLASAYFKAAKDGSAAITKAIGDLYNAFRFLIDRGGSLNIAQLMQRLSENLNKASNPLHAQYTYDFYKDVIVAYNELRDMLYNVAFECCPNIYAFPKHIMLGGANISYGPQPPKYRHQFYPSPAITRNRTQDNNAIGMLKRLQLMVMNFELKEAEAIRITPSKDYDRPLEDRAIPFYYGKPADLTKEWNYRRTLKANENLNLSYNAAQYTPPVPDETLNPLDYGIDDFNFFRIEGHVGKDWKTVLRQLDALKNSKGLPVDIVAVRLGDAKLSDINLDDFECHFEDLYTMLRAFQTEISCLLGEGSNFFSGFTARPEFPHLNLERYIPPPDQPKWFIRPDLIKNLVPKAGFEKLKFDAGLEPKTEPVNIKAGAREAIISSGELLTANIREKATELGRLDLKLDICDRFLRPVFRVDRIVKETLDPHPEAFGKFILKALEEPVNTVDELIEKTRNFAAADPSVTELFKDEANRNVLFEYPVQIVAHLNFVQRFVPGSIKEITPKFILDYRNFSLSFCRRLKVMRARLERHFRTGNYASRGFESTYLNMLDRMERICCSNEKLEVIMREIERRKTEILSHLSFSKFITRHRGLEHKAGTHRGGTFVIVYAGAQSPSQPQRVFPDLTRVTDLTRDVTAVRLAEKTLPQYRDIESFAMYIVNNDEKIDREAELANFLAVNRIQPASAFAELAIRELNTRVTEISRIICKDLTQPPAEVVVADFSLPYLCCSECPPVAFIVEKEKTEEPEPEPEPEPVDLDLKPIQFCSDDSSLYPFDVTPENGEVATKDINIANAVVKDPSSQKFSFNPSLVPAAQFGKPIGFTVNNQEVSLSVIVFKKPVAKILEPEVTEGPADLVVVLTAEQNPTDQGNFAYQWTFGDGTKLDGQVIQAHFKKAAFEDGIPVTLTVTNGPCSSTDSITIPFKGEEPVQTCPQIVAAFIKEKRDLLNSDQVAKAVSGTGNRMVESFYASTREQFDGMPSLFLRPTPARVLKAIQEIDALLKQMYEFTPPARNLVIPRIIEEFIRMLIMLMLNLVRCISSIPENQRLVITTHIALFHSLRPELQKKYPQLNDKKTFEEAVTDFAKNYASQDPVLFKSLNTLVKAIRQFV